jgi:hypothetical protein
MRKFALGALLVVMPFGGIRVICAGSPMEPSHPAARVEAVSDCERLCPLHPPSAAPSESDDLSLDANASDCALSVDGATMSVVVSTAVPRPHAVFPVPAVASALPADSGSSYVGPALPHLVPPPKSRAL